MNKSRLFASIAVVVLAVFWAVVILDYYATVFAVVIMLITPFIVLLVIGTYGVMDSLGVGPRGGAGSGRSGGEIGPLGLTVLKMTAQGKNQQEIAAATLVSPMVIQAKLDSLRRAGFLQDNGLSEKGFDLVGR